MSNVEDLSAVDELLKTNDPPAEAQVPAVQKSLETRLDRLAVFRAKKEAIHEEVIALRSQLADLEDELKALEKAIDSVEVDILAHASVLSVVRRIAPEILGEIFRLTLPHTRRVGARVASVAPWLLCHVSRNWRAVARGDALLWSHIRVNTISPIPDQAHPLCPLETQIRLSANAPLTIDFFVGPGVHRHGNRHVPHIRRLLDAIVRQSNRWEIARLYWSADSSDSLASLAGIVAQLAQLRHLAFHPYLRTTELPVALLSIFAAAPALREVLLTDDGFCSPSPQLELPWPQLTLLRLCSSQSYLFKSLPRAVNLMECAIGPIQGIADPCFDVLLLPSLRRLTLYRTEPWLGLKTPLLEYLHLEGPIDPIPQILSSNPLPHLKSLKLTEIMSDAPTTLPILLRHVPHTLTELDVYFDYDRDDDLEDISSDAERGFISAFVAAMKRSHTLCVTLFPRLTLLRIGLPYEFEYTDELDGSLFEMVASRWKRVTDSGPGEVP
ncbi:hypothetical protein R3P38DRAFT_2888522, partial [Favolaschia claudopus]